ncbi:DUF4133 domain-containing protein [Pedobacter sp. SYP-B3415]|uniref:DUF4133 domain-containing protein n=1 Tax=Pedobacter sp. SYP-B3415 TaxID=2496641 RepID=UPI00101D3F95
MRVFGCGSNGFEVFFWHLKMASVYQINHGVSRPIVVKGLKGYYVGILAVGLLVLLLLFVSLYLLDVPLGMLFPMIVALTMALIYLCRFLSQKFGPQGLMKFLARGNLPKAITLSSRQTFLSLSKRRAI